MKLKSYDKITKWIVDDDGKLIAVINQLGNDKWAVFKGEKRLMIGIHDTPRAAFNAYKRAAGV